MDVKSFLNAVVLHVNALITGLLAPIALVIFVLQLKYILFQVAAKATFIILVYVFNLLFILNLSFK